MSYQEEIKPRKKRFEVVFGPAFFAILFQSAILIIGFAYNYGKSSERDEVQQNTLDKVVKQVDKNNKDILSRFELHSRNTSDIIAVISQRQNDRTNGINDRLIAVETTIGGIKNSLKIVIDKLDKAANRIN